MNHTSVPLIPPPRPGPRDRLLRACASAALTVSLVVSPRPAVALIRRVFTAGGAATGDRLARHAPTGVATVADERYGTRPDEVLDVHRPAAATDPLPVVMWVHGGGWLAGSKDEAADYLRLVARDGYAVVAPDYTLAPDAHYPGPVRQLAAALTHVQQHAGRLGLDPRRIVIAGDSAGAQLAAQLAALVTTPGYADQVGVAAPTSAERLRGVVLACGPYDLQRLAVGRSGIAQRLVHAVLWAYSGHRHHMRDPRFATASVIDHISPAFPPALITVGNADSLRAHSHLLAQRLRDLDRAPETVFFPEDHTPALAHEYQFDLDTDDGRAFLERLREFLARHLATSEAVARD